MKTAFIVRAPSDGAAAAALAEALEEAGLQQARRPVRRDRYEVETLAARMKAADVAIVLLSQQAAASLEFRRELHLALLYDRPFVVGALDAGADVAALASDPEIVVGTPYADRTEALRDRLADAARLWEARDEAGEAAGDEELEAWAAPATSGVAPLVERARKEVAVSPAAAARTDDEDALGFPKSPETMLARWRLIAPAGAIDDFRAFHQDYEADPFFGPLAADAIAGVRRRRVMRGAGGVANWIVGTAAAAALFGGVIFACSDGGCVAPGATTAAPLATAGVIGAPSRTDADVVISGLEEEVDDLANALAAEQEATRRLEAALAAARADLVRAERAAALDAADATAAEALAAERARADALAQDAAEADARAAELEATAVAAAGRAAEAELRAAAAEARAAEAEARALAAEGLAAEAEGRAAEAEELAAAAEELATAADGRAALASEADGRLAAAEERAAAAERRAEAADAQRAAAADALAAAITARDAAISDLAAARRDVGGAVETSGRGAARLMELLGEGLRAEDQRRREAGLRDALGGPTLNGPRLERLQICLRDVVGAPRAADGLWGARTTEAIVGLSVEEAEAVAACVFG